MTRLFASFFALSLLVFTGCGGSGIYFQATTTSTAAKAPAPIVISGHTINTAVVNISDISVHTSNAAGVGDAGWTALSLQNNTTLDLVALEGSVNTILGAASLATATYQQIRFGVASATITIDGSPTPITVTVPSNKIALHFTPPVSLIAGNSYGVLLNFNLLSALSLHSGTWSLTINASTLTNTPYLINADGSHTPITTL